MGPGISLIGGGKNVSVAAAIGLANGRVDHIRVFGVRHDAFNAIEVPVQNPIGQWDPKAVGVIPTIGSPHVGAHINEVLGQGAVADPGNITTRGNNDIFPDIGLG